jgi:hypothetical protein
MLGYLAAHTGTPQNICVTKLIFLFVLGANNALNLEAHGHDILRSTKRSPGHKF